MGDRTSTPDTIESLERHARSAMAGFDDLPRDLRLFLHQHVMHPSQINEVAYHLRMGRPVEIGIGGATTTLRP